MEKKLKIWFVTPQMTMRPKEYNHFGDRESYSIYLARNATEGCQMSIISLEGARKNMSVEIVNDCDAGFTVELLREHYVSCDGALFPDPVVPNDTTFDLEEMKSVTYLINIVTTADTKPGGYGIKVILRQDGEIYGEYDIWVTVWNFTIDHSALMETAFGMERTFLEKICKPTDIDECYKKYYDFMLERYHICAGFLPYDILDDRADEYMNNPAVKSFRIPYDGKPETVTAYYNKLKTNPEWLKKAMFYVVDEPQRMGDYDRIRAVCEKLEKIFPDYQLVVPYYMDPRDGNGARAVDLMEKYNIVWCPKSSLFRDEWLKDYMALRRKKGERTWWYCCWEPQLPYANLFIDMEGFYHRVLFWQQYLYGINGFLYWQSTHWNNGSPWDVTSPVPELSYYCFGDGSLLYNGDRIGIDGPVGSLRLEIVRSAIEDYHMFEIAEKIFGREYVEEQIRRVSKNVREYCDDHRILAKLRWEIGEKISEYYNNK